MSKACDNRIIDLFSGVGGFSLGAHAAGFKPMLAIDNDKNLTYSFQTNFPNVRLVHCDLSELPPPELLKIADIKKGQLAGIIGGPPCQGFSFIGKRNPDDPRNHLVHCFFQYIHHLEPAFFVMENVPGLLSSDFISKLTSGIELVGDKFQVLPPLTLNAANFGAATLRKRVFIIGYRLDCIGEIKAVDVMALASKTGATVYDAIYDLPSLDSAFIDSNGEYWAKYASKPESDYARRARQAPSKDVSINVIRDALKEGVISGFQPTYHTDRVVARFKTLKPGERDRVSRSNRLSWNALCTSLRAGTGSDHGSYQSLRPIHPEENRVISVREAARIQGFPDWFQFHPTIWHSFRMIGNSVSPYVSEAILGLLATRMGISNISE